MPTKRNLELLPPSQAISLLRQPPNHTLTRMMVEEKWSGWKENLKGHMLQLPAGLNQINLKVLEGSCKN